MAGFFCSSSLTVCITDRLDLAFSARAICLVYALRSTIWHWLNMMWMCVCGYWSSHRTIGQTKWEIWRVVAKSEKFRVYVFRCIRWQLPIAVRFYVHAVRLNCELSIATSDNNQTLRPIHKWIGSVIAWWNSILFGAPLVTHCFRTEMWDVIDDHIPTAIISI